MNNKPVTPTYGAFVNERIKKRESEWLTISVVMLAVQIIMLVSMIVMANVHKIADVSSSYYSYFVLSCFVLSVLAIMFQSSIRSVIPDSSTVIFMGMILVNSLYVFCDAMSWILNGRQDYRVFNYIFNMFSYLSVVLIAWLFWHFLRSWLKPVLSEPRGSNMTVNIAAAAGCLLILFNPIGGFLFTVTQSGVYLKGTMFSLSFAAPGVIVAVTVISILIQKISRKDKIILLSYPLLPAVASLFVSGSDGPTLTSAFCFCSLFFVFCNLYIRRERELVKKQAELAESKINAMMLQINPHFIYNTLGSVATLCTEDPKAAESLLYSFSSYLRNNFGEMAQKSLIPFDKEADHVKSYIEIERVRFPDIDVQYDYRVTAFEIPSLSIQPLVENAIKHGIMGRENGGTVKITTFEDASAYHITVEDNGIGFDGSAPPDDGKNHIGLNNVKSRLNLLCDGDLIIKSTVGVGTVAEIIIPKEKNI